MCLQEHLEECRCSQELDEGWLLARRFGEGGDKLVPVEPAEKIQWQHQTFGVDYKPAARYPSKRDPTIPSPLGTSSTAPPDTSLPSR